MSLSELCIRRPVFATVISLVIVLLGVVSYQRLPVREYPNIDEPVVSVETTYRGASAEVIESQVTQVLEDSLAGIEGIDVHHARSAAPGAQPDHRPLPARRATRRAAARRARPRRRACARRLPDEIDEPVIAKVEADAQPIIYLAFSIATGTRRSRSPTTPTAIVKDRLQTLPGVADVRIFGERRYAMRIWLDRARLAAYGITPQDVEDALRRAERRDPGRAASRAATREFTVLSRDRPARRRSSSTRIIVKRRRRLSRCACATSARAELGAARRARSPSASTASPPWRSASSSRRPPTRSTSRSGVRAELPRITRDLPEGMQVEVAYDTSVFIEALDQGGLHARSARRCCWSCS